MLQRFRASGADLPFGDPTRSHPGVAMEGYFWRITDPGTGRVIIALCGANQSPRGSWATIGLASWPPRFLRTAAYDGAWTDPNRLGVRGGTIGGSSVFDGNERRLQVDLGTDARLGLTFQNLHRWPTRRAFGGSSIFQLIPGLNQYWHPWLLGGTASGTARLGDETWRFTDGQVYGEKNWGTRGIPGGLVVGTGAGVCGTRRERRIRWWHRDARTDAGGSHGARRAASGRACRSPR